MVNYSIVMRNNPMDADAAKKAYAKKTMIAKFSLGGVKTLAESNPLPKKTQSTLHA